MKFISAFVCVSFSTALPPTFIKELKNLEAEEGNGVTLRCELSKPGVSVEWRKGAELLRTGEKYQTRQREGVQELVIRKALPEDSGVYTCVCKEQKTAAIISITGNRDSMSGVRKTNL